MTDHRRWDRRPVFSGNRRIPGLYERDTAAGLAYDFAAKVNGKLVRRRLFATTKTDAINESRALSVDLRRGEAHKSPAAGLTLGDLARDYLEHLRSRIGHRDPRRRFSARTVDLYEQRLRQWIVPELGHLQASEVTVADLRKLVDKLGAAGLAPSTVTGILSITSGLFRFAVKSGLAERNPVRDLDRDDRPGTARLTEPRYLTADEIAAVLAKMGETFHPIIVACVFAALRISEALGLRWRDVDFDAGTITVAGQLGAHGELVPVKSEASAATLPLLPALARELRAHRSRQAGIDLRRVHRDALVYVTSRGRPQSRRNALRALHAAGDAAGLNGDGREPVGLHDLRHSFVANLLEAEGSLAEAAALARHANARVTATVYAGLTESGRAAAVAKLERAGFGR